MMNDPSRPLAGVVPESVTPANVDGGEILAALDSPNPLVRQKGIAVCERIAEAKIDAIEPYLDEVAQHAGDDDIVVAMGAIEVLDTVAKDEPAVLEGRLSCLVEALDTDYTNVQLRGGRLLADLVVERPSLLVPHVRDVVETIGAAGLDAEARQFQDVVDDPVTRQTLQEHEEVERKRRVAGRRTLVNVVVAVAEAEPVSAPAVVDALVVLLEDIDPAIIGGAIDALGEIATWDPSAVTPACGDLIECLDHDRPVVRARAIRALGRLGDSEAVPKLRTVAESDDDENIRELAEETADFLSRS